MSVTMNELPVPTGLIPYVTPKDKKTELHLQALMMYFYIEMKFYPMDK